MLLSARLALFGWCVLGGGVCDHGVQMLLVQDGTSSAIYSDTSSIADDFYEIYDNLSSAFAATSIGLTAFTDKPTPFRGIGNGRGFEGELDFCYRNIKPLRQIREERLMPSDNGIESTVQAMRYIASSIESSGGDSQENPYEALLYSVLDPQNQLALSADDEKSTVRVAVIFTDDLPHYEGDVQKGIDQWNGAFGDESLIHSQQHFNEEMPAIYGGAEVNGANYLKLISLKPDDADYDKLMELLGPAKYEDAKTHPGTFEAADLCAEYEYPSLKRVGEALASHHVIPIVVLTRPLRLSAQSRKVCETRGYMINDKAPTDTQIDEFMTCMQSIYKDDLENTMNLDRAFVLLHTRAFVSELDELMRTLEAEKECIIPPPIILPGHSPGSSAWIGGAIAGGAAIGVGLLGYCIYPCCTCGLLRHNQITPGDPFDWSRELSEESISVDGSEACSWTAYI